MQFFNDSLNANTVVITGIVTFIYIYI